MILVQCALIRNYVPLNNRSVYRIRSVPQLRVFPNFQGSISNWNWFNFSGIDIVERRAIKLMVSGRVRK